MKNSMKIIFSLLFVFLCVYVSLAQDEISKPEIKRPVYFDVSPPLRDMPTITARTDNTWKVIKNYFNARKNRNKDMFPSDWKDPLVQRHYKMSPATQDSTIENFLGNTNTQGYDPPDTYGDVGPNHYFQVVNCHFAIYSKTGSLLLGPTSTETIWSGMPNNSNGGDGIVLYDEQADRWLIAQLSYPSGYDLEMVAVSQTSDPTGSWYRWEYSFTGLPDYPKFGVWPDGYYMAVNRFNASGTSYLGTGQAAFDRTAMLAGNPTAQMVYLTLPSNNNAYALLPSDCDGAFPPTGTPNYFVYMMDGPDYLGVYEFHVDWTNPANSTFGNFLQLTVNNFNDNLSNIPQKGTSRLAEVLSDRLMVRLQFRQFSDHWSMVTNHTVSGSGNTTGIRWYELRKTTSDWGIYQQSTYSPPDGNYRWMGSIAMDTTGNMALGYSISSSNMYPAIKFTARLANDPLNVMTIPEKGIYYGTGSNTSSDGGGYCRWGDYSSMTVDPSDGTTFWYTQQYNVSMGTNWQTRIASFIPGNILNVTLTASPDTINAGENSQLTDTVSGGNGTYSFSWSSVPAGFTSTIQNPVVSPTINTIYVLQVTSGSQTSIDSVEVFVNLSMIASSNPDTIMKGDSSQLNITAYGGDGIYNYVWTSIPAGYYSTLSNPYVKPTQTTRYIAFVFANSQVITDTTNVTVLYGVGVDEKNNSFHVLITPNPTTGIFSLTITGLKEQEDITLFNSQGQIIFRDKYNFEKSKYYNFTNLSKGLYYLKVGNQSQKLLID